MANNVYTVVSIESSKKVIKNFVDKIFTPEVEEADWQKKSDILADNLYGLLYKDYPKDNLTREWMTENVGAKWCFIHDWQIDDDIIDLTFDSAWYPPEELFHELADWFAKRGEFEMEARSEDEAYLHVSGGYANQNGSEFIMEDENLPEYPNDEDFEDNEDEYAYDEAVDNFYNKISEIKDDLILECKQDLILYP
jgi:hypothetical protein